MSGWLFVIAGYALIIWRTHQYLRTPRIGRRAQLRMSVSNSKVHFGGER